MLVQKTEFSQNYFVPHMLPIIQPVKQNFGGGVAFKLDIIQSRYNKPTFIQFTDVLFQNNTSELGGAIFIASLNKARRKLVISFRGCQFIGNQAFDGGAICVMTTDFGMFVRLGGVVYLQNCTFENNRAINVSTLETKGSLAGSIFCLNSRMYISNATMVNNYAASGGSLYDLGCIIVLNKTTIGIDERISRLAFQTGAIYSSGLQVMEDVKIEIKKPIVQTALAPYIWDNGYPYSTRTSAPPPQKSSH